jgi:membrane-associated phospholipid phosphatase
MFSNHIWMALTHLGAAAAILPMVPAIGLGLWQEKRHSVATTWAVALFVGIVIVLVSKFAFIGWGLGIARLDFTGISGHTLLATAILPVVCAWLPLPRAGSILATVLGVGLAVLVGWSRVVLGAHSWSEVVAGWGLGAMVSGIVVYRMLGSRTIRCDLFGMRGLIVATLLVMLSMSQTMAVTLPAHSLEVRIALALSGRDQPFSRRDLHRQVE